MSDRDDGERGRRPRDDSAPDALATLEALEARGVRLSRNRHFALFQHPANAAALDLHRRLEALRDELVRHWHAGHLALGLEAPDEAGRWGLIAQTPPLATRHEARLHPATLAALATREPLGVLFQAAGLDTARPVARAPRLVPGPDDPDHP